MEEQGTGDGEQGTGNDGSRRTANPLRRGADIAERLLAFAATILEMAKGHRRDAAGRHVTSQLVRSATSAGANYAEARAAESRADFIHKVRIAAKEMHEAGFWLRLVQRSALARIDDARFVAVIREADELAAILMASARTARRSAT